LGGDFSDSLCLGHMRGAHALLLVSAGWCSARRLHTSPCALGLTAPAAAPLPQEQKQAGGAALENEMSYNEALIEERDQGITEIAQQIGEVNEIFQARARGFCPGT